jgi:cytochrome c oxidase subunit II
MTWRFMPVAGSAHAAALDAVLQSVHTHMALQAIAWGMFFVYVLVRFRRAAQPRAQHAGIRPLIPVAAVALVIAGDAVILATAALPAWFERSEMPSSVAAPLEINIEGEQFVWNIHYPGPDGKFGRTSQALIGASNPLGIDRTDANAHDDIGLLNLLTLPLGRPVIVHLSSRDVIHSLTLNEMRVRQDAVPGIPTRTWFTPIVAGHWDIACSQLCGVGHYRMRGEYRVLPLADWDRWLASELALLRPAQ